MEAVQQTKRQKYMGRLSALRNERATWEPTWRDIEQYILPHRTRFYVTDTNKGTRRDTEIANNTPTVAMRTLAAGMMAGMTSPSREWFSLTTHDPELAQYGAVRSWLNAVQDRIRQVFHSANIYNALHQSYEYDGGFGHSAIFIDDDAESVLRAYVLQPGAYFLANGARQQVDTIYREASLTVGQMVEMFCTDKATGRCDLGKVSQRVRTMYEGGKFDEWVEVVHLVEPSREYIPGRGFKYASCWLEKTASEEDGFLRESGYDEFPTMCARWFVAGDSVYGTGPGEVILGDSKALQLLEKRGMQALDKIVKPPLRAPVSLQGQRIGLLPGDVTYVNGHETQQSFGPAYTVNPQALAGVENAVARHERRINRGAYADLWLLVSQGENDPQKTAREIAEVHEEKMLQLGPVMERQEDEKYSPLIARTFAILLRNGDLPPPPREMQGQEVRVEFQSMMATAQKMLGLRGVERLTSFIGNVAAGKPDALDKLNTDKVIDEYGKMLGVKPELLRTDDEVAQLRADRAKQQAQAAALQQGAAAVQGAKVLSETDTSSDNALTRIIGQNGAPAQ